MTNTLSNKVVETQELLPCPFCGHDVEMRPWHGGGPDKQLVSCSWGEYQWPHGCPVAPHTTGETKAEAIAAWNTRTTQCSGDTQAVELLREARGFIAVRGAFTREYTDRLLTKLDSHLGEMK